MSLLNSTPLAGAVLGGSGGTAVTLTELLGTVEAAGSVAFVYNVKYVPAAAFGRAVTASRWHLIRAAVAQSDAKAVVSSSFAVMRGVTSAGQAAAQTTAALVAEFHPTSSGTAAAAVSGSAARWRPATAAQVATATGVSNYFVSHPMFASGVGQAVASGRINRGQVITIAQSCLATPAAAVTLRLDLQASQLVQAVPLGYGVLVDPLLGSGAQSATATVAAQLRNIFHRPTATVAPTAQTSSSARTTVPLFVVGSIAASALAASPVLRNIVVRVSATQPAVATSVCTTSEISAGPVPEERRMRDPDDDRLMESTDMALLNTFRKQPADKLDYEIDFGGSLPVGDNIFGTPTVLIEPSGLVEEGAPIVDAQKVKLWFSGGTNGITYKITVTATSNAGRIKQNEFRIKVKDV